jgi:hypothetical protein
MPFVKGQSGNPGGRRKATKDDLDLAKACRQRTPAALAVIERLMTKADSDTVRLRAAVTIIERGYGAAQVLPPGGDEMPPASVPVIRQDASIPEPD